MLHSPPTPMFSSGRLRKSFGWTLQAEIGGASTLLILASRQSKGTVHRSNPNLPGMHVKRDIADTYSTSPNSPLCFIFVPFHYPQRTWVTGDQHLSNFGAWRNRHGDLVFSVNDFDEAAIYGKCRSLEQCFCLLCSLPHMRFRWSNRSDFQIDVLRIAVSVCNHAFSNGLSEEQVEKVLKTFTDTYLETVSPAQTES